MRAFQILVTCFIFFVSCRKVNHLETIEKIDSNFVSENSVHLTHTSGAINRFETYGVLGNGISDSLKDSVLRWNRKDLDLTDQRMKFHLFVDTATTLPLDFDIEGLVYQGDSSNYSIKSTFKKYNYEWASFNSHPVYIINKDTADHILEFQDGAVYMIHEAQDSLGNWRPIENWVFTHFCGNSYYELVFKPKYYLVSKVLQHDGDYETNLRLKLRNFDEVIYSNPFRGRISYDQFNDSMFVNYSKIHAQNYYSDKPDSLDFYASQYLSEMRLEK